MLALLQPLLASLVGMAMSVFGVTLDHASTSVVHLARHGLWIAMPGPAGEVAVLQQAFNKAQAQLAAHAGTEAHLQAARQHTTKVLSDLVASKGWTLQVHWQP
jgi:hypothetical protein